MSDYATDYTVDELVTASIARNIQNGELIQQGGNTPLAIVAVALARLTHAPRAVYNFLGSIDPLLYELDDPNFVEAGSETALMPLEFLHAIGMALRGKIDVFTGMPAQIDQYGNVNISLIGDPAKTRARFPGGYGIPDWILYVRRVFFYLPRHTTQTFAERVDYITGTGHFPGGLAERRRRGIPGQGPEKIFSNIAVLGFDPETGRMRIESIHPGVSAEDLRSNTGFELLAPAEIPETEPPTREQVDLLRNRIDPKGLRKQRF